ncbi:uncharacterized protein LOC129168702 [Dunckerocampus dactyliophorus]|uniref:uncharacterized protein LOC129168702 n=1 Tax=Dunckerocampus dactyliophorus TaxID=161453 RepID=UPI002406E814|nr:uncharacterized protein LOC129168702 [Dunckerocampus dactyliophorus]XP_054610238.1 uncharacterized protein LOC129168702 [Dunckerocampus dactyliophorus]XP_054610239.1 uncharacterized protein LOC129168702 [Dunckerocampus dactyliophorus]
MFKIHGIPWKRTLTSILEELSNDQLQKLLEHHLDKIPQSRKESLSRDHLSQLIVEHYGEEKSINLIQKAMKDIPRKDEAVMSLLLPYVHNVKEMKRKRAEARKLKKNDTTTQRKTSAAKKVNMNAMTTKEEISADVSPRHHAEKIGRSTADDEDGSRGLQDLLAASVQSWRMSIQDLKRGDQLAGKAIVCKVVKKTALLTYETKDKATKCFFCLGVTDETDSVKVMVYGEQRYQELKEGNYFLFRDVLVESDILKLTSRSSISRTTAFPVPERLEMEACSLLSPQCTLCSIAQAKMAADGTFVSVTGTVIAIGSLGHVLSKVDDQEKVFQELTLRDGADSIAVCLWEAAIGHLDRLSLGDVVRVTNVKKKCFSGDATLSSTVFTRIFKDKSTPHLAVLLVGIERLDMAKMRLDAKVDDQVLTLMADPGLVAEACGEQLDEQFEDKLLNKLPLSANVELAGNYVKAMKTTTHPIICNSSSVHV